MILHQEAGVRKHLGDDSKPSVAPHGFPPTLTALPIWACWRARKKAHKGGHRIVYQPVHPFSGAEPRGDHREEWASFEDALLPRLRKPTDGIGVYLTQDSGLAVVFNASSDLAARLREQAVYVERAAHGDGLTVIVRTRVHGAVTGRFVPLSGQPPYQGADEAMPAPRQDAGRTPGGHDPCQEIAPAGQGPYQKTGLCQDTGRTLVS